MFKKVMAALILGMILASHGCTRNVRRYGSVIGIKEEALPRYQKLHANPWPEVKARLKEANIRNYSIYLTQFPDGRYYLFSYFEYAGDDFKADMERMGHDPKVKEWWQETDPCQLPLANRAENEWWKGMEEVFHLD